MEKGAGGGKRGFERGRVWGELRDGKRVRQRRADKDKQTAKERKKT